LDRAPLAAEAPIGEPLGPYWGGKRLLYRGAPKRRPIKKKFGALLKKICPP